MEDKRRFARFDNSFEQNQKSPNLLVLIPALTEAPIQPEDFSAGGFRLRLKSPPDIGTEFDCTVKVLYTSLMGLRSRVVWIAQVQPGPLSWDVGLDIRISEGEQDILSSLLTVLLAGNHIGS